MKEKLGQAQVREATKELRARARQLRLACRGEYASWEPDDIRRFGTALANEAERLVKSGEFENEQILLVIRGELRK